MYFLRHPVMRGKHVTKPIEEVLREARELADDGVRELIVVAQDTTYYGLDLYGEVRLAELLRELETVEGLEWIRVLYAYPMYFTDELIETLARSRKIIPYLDMPLQHINDRVLKRMQRRVNRAATEDLLARLRRDIPALTMRTTFIVGFPGETEAEFEELREFVKDARFERAGVFTYSFEPGTPAARLDDHLPEDVKTARRDALMEVQQEVAFAWAEAQVGQELEVIVDGPDPEVPGHYLAQPSGRSGHRLRGAPQGQKPGRGRPGTGPYHRGGRLRSGGPGDSRTLSFRFLLSSDLDHGHNDSQQTDSLQSAQPAYLGPLRPGPGAVRADHGRVVGLVPDRLHRGRVHRLAGRLPRSAAQHYQHAGPEPRSAGGQGAHVRRLCVPAAAGLQTKLVAAVDGNGRGGPRADHHQPAQLPGNAGARFGADWLGKVKMGLQCAAVIAIFVTLALRNPQWIAYFETRGPTVVWAFALLRDILIWAMLAATLLSGLQYLWRAALIYRMSERV